MGLVIGIDVGGSTTKIVGVENGTDIKAPISTTGGDPISSLFGAFGKYTHDNGVALDDIEHVMLTGVGASEVNTPIYNLHGQRLSQPAKGVSIIGGKKVIVK